MYIVTALIVWFPDEKLTVILILSHPTPTHTAHTALLTQLTGRLLFMNHLKGGFLTGFCSQQISLLATLLQLLQNTSLEYVFFFFLLLSLSMWQTALFWSATSLPLKYNLNWKVLLNLVNNHCSLSIHYSSVAMPKSLVILHSSIKMELNYITMSVLVGEKKNTIMCTPHLWLRAHFKNSAQSHHIPTPHDNSQHEILLHSVMHRFMERKCVALHRKEKKKKNTPQTQAQNRYDYKKNIKASTKRKYQPKPKKTTTK